jgi:hypothetical protein
MGKALTVTFSLARAKLKRVDAARQIMHLAPQWAPLGKHVRCYYSLFSLLSVLDFLTVSTCPLAFHLSGVPQVTTADSRPLVD